MVAPLDLRSRDGANSARLADAAVSQWQAIDAALAPVIGKSGVAALYHRSLFLTLKTHPWLDHERSPDVLDLPALRAALVAARDPAEVPEASATLLRAFKELLASLVGDPLAGRLLGPVVQRYIEVESPLRRVMAVAKVRDSMYPDELRAYTVDADGIQIGDTLPGEEGLLGGRPTRKSGRAGPTS